MNFICHFSAHSLGTVTFFHDSPTGDLFFPTNFSNLVSLNTMHSMGLVTGLHKLLLLTSYQYENCLPTPHLPFPLILIFF